MKSKKILIIIAIITVTILSLVACAPDSDNKHKVVFDYDYGLIAESVFVKDGEKVAAPNNPTREGYDLSYWELNGKPFDFDTPITSDIILKARWEEKKYITIPVAGDKKVIEITKDSYSLDDFKDITIEDASLVGFYKIVEDKKEYVDLSKGIKNIGTMYPDFLSTDLELKTNDNEVEVVKYNGNKTSIKIPNFYEGKPVTVFGVNAFANKTISQMTFPFYLHTIKTGAFSETVIGKIIIPPSVKKIETLAFANCYIENIAFAKDSQIEEIETRAFCFIKELKTLKFPLGLKKLDMETVYYCQELQKVYIPNSVLDLQNYIFKGCQSLNLIYRQEKLEEEVYLEGLNWNYIGETATPGSSPAVKVVPVLNEPDFK